MIQKVSRHHICNCHALSLIPADLSVSNYLITIDSDKKINTL